MKISVCNLLKLKENDYKCFYLLPGIVWQKVEGFNGIWICLFNLGIYINFKRED